MIYDLDFILGIIGLLLNKMMSFCILLFIFNFVDKLKGWSLDQILFIFGFSSASFALWHCFFINTISLPYYIRNGLLDSFLLRPINPIFQIMTDGFDEDGWGDLIFGISILVIAIIKLKLFSFYLLIIPLLIIGASLIYASISLLFSIFSFFTIGNTNFSNLVYDFNEFAKYPLPLYNQFLRIIFTSIIPIGFASYYPSLFFISNFKQGMLIGFLSPFIALLFFLITYKIWFFSLKFYKSSGT
ncbi:MAG: ABC-2 family transporter protein [Exilispira sp.]|jgi:ABC-2 type transport system permease protein|nr:ABC-2 family transporter protein [Exilispira sp.]